MATQDQYNNDPWIRREVVTPELDWLGDEMCRRTGRPRGAGGTKGDRHHMNGGHRSNEFIVNSPLCTNRSYTRQSGLSAEQQRHVAAFDFTPGEWGSSRNRALMVEQTTRLRAAMLDGRLSGVREVIGTLDGRNVRATRADGSTFSADDSHLEHYHLTIDRRQCRNKTLMERIIATALNEPEEEMDLTEENVAAISNGVAKVLNVRFGFPVGPASGPAPVDWKQVAGQVATIDGNVSALPTPAAIADAVYARAGEQGAPAIAAALRAVLGPDLAAEVAALLAGTGT